MNDLILIFRRAIGSVKSEPRNVAIPSRSFIPECEGGTLHITLYVQFEDGFLAMENLSKAIEVWFLKIIAVHINKMCLFFTNSNMNKGTKMPAFINKVLVHNTMIPFNFDFLILNILEPLAPTDVRGFCDVVVWPLLVQPGGEVFAYDIRFYIPGTVESTTVSLGKNRILHCEQ